MRNSRWALVSPQLISNKVRSVTSRHHIAAHLAAFVNILQTAQSSRTAVGLHKHRIASIMQSKREKRHLLRRRGGDGQVRPCGRGSGPLSWAGLRMLSCWSIHEAQAGRAGSSLSCPGGASACFYTASPPGGVPTHAPVTRRCCCCWTQGSVCCRQQHGVTPSKGSESQCCKTVNSSWSTQLRLQVNAYKLYVYLCVCTIH